MPISRKMEGMGAGVLELRFKERSGIYRVIYFIKKVTQFISFMVFKRKRIKHLKRILRYPFKR